MDLYCELLLFGGKILNFFAMQSCNFVIILRKHKKEVYIGIIIVTRTTRTNGNNKDDRRIDANKKIK